MTTRAGNRAESRTDRNSGNIYERLDNARKKREQVLETPVAANDDRQAKRLSQQTAARPFPTLKPPTDFPQAAPEASRSGWLIPMALAVLIVGVIFAFAVS